MRRQTGKNLLDRSYWTDRRYESAREAKSLLALGTRPELRMEFDAVEVEVIRVDSVD
jgi:hypothetical protein